MIFITYLKVNIRTITMNNLNLYRDYKALENGIRRIKNNIPNEWGRQEWENKLYKRQLATTNNLPREQKTFIQKFVEENITGIRSG